MSMLHWLRAAAAAILLLAAPMAHAEEHIVRMLNANPDDPNQTNIFDPPILRIEPGDTVTFVPTDSGHNSATKRGMVPDGAEPWNSGLDERFSVTLTVEGTYGYVCVPHLEMGMVGLILVGDYTGNFDAARKVRQIGGARSAFRALFSEVEEGAQ